MSDRFEFTSEFVGETFEEAAEVTGVEAPVDPENPGFASLLTALNKHRAGEVPKIVLWEYVGRLGLHISDCHEKLGQMQVPEAIRPHFDVAMQAMTGALSEFQEVIDHLATYLETNESEALDRAQERLEMIHQEFPIFIGQLQQYSQLPPAEAPAPSEG